MHLGFRVEDQVATALGNVGSATPGHVTGSVVPATLSTEKAAHPAGQSALLGGAFVVQKVIGVDGGARLSEERAGVPHTFLADVLREGCLDDVVTVPADPVDAKAEDLLPREAAVQLYGVGASLVLTNELVA